MSNETNEVAFNCRVRVTGNETVGFAIDGMRNSQRVEIMVNDFCDVKAEENIATCTNTSTELRCSYNNPYEVDCNFTVKDLDVSSSASIECFIAQYNGEITKSQRAGLYIIRKSHPPNLEPHPLRNV